MSESQTAATSSSTPTTTEDPTKLSKHQQVKLKLYESTKKILYYVDRTHQLHYRLIRRLDGGLCTGAYLIQSNSDQNTLPSQLVLKWSNNKQWYQQVQGVHPVIECLVQQYKYTTAQWYIVGVSPSGYSYVLQHYVGNAHPCTLNELNIQLIDQLKHNWNIQHNYFTEKQQFDISHVSNWSLNMRTMLYEKVEFNIYMNQTHPVLYTRIMNIANRYQDTVLSTCDFVHGDYNLSNILLSHNNNNMCVIDIEQGGVGTVLFDICNVLLNTCKLDDTVVFDYLYAYAVSLNRRIELILCSCWHMCLQLRYYEYQDTTHQTQLMQACLKLCGQIEKLSGTI